MTSVDINIHPSDSEEMLSEIQGGGRCAYVYKDQKYTCRVPECKGVSWDNKGNYTRHFKAKHQKVLVMYSSDK